MKASSETMQGVIDAIVENRRRFEAFCYSLDEQELMRPVPDSTWVVRDFAAHLDTLDVALVRWLEAVGAGGQVDSSRDVDGAAFDIDAFNEVQVIERRSWPLEQVFEEAHRNRALLLEQMVRLTDAQIDKPMNFAADAKRKASVLPLKLFLAGWSQHDPIHVADMLKALPERAADAEVVSWLSNPFVKGYQAVMNPAATP